MLDQLANLADVFFNGREAKVGSPKPTPSAVTIPELIKRRTSHVRCGGKLYKVVVTEVEITATRKVRNA